MGKYCTNNIGIWSHWSQQKNFRTFQFDLFRFGQIQRPSVIPDQITLQIRRRTRPSPSFFYFSISYHSFDRSKRAKLFSLKSQPERWHKQSAHPIHFSQFKTNTKSIDIYSVLRCCVLLKNQNLVSREWARLIRDHQISRNDEHSINSISLV